MKPQINKKYLRALCAASGWRLAELAAAAQLDDSTISRVINGGGCTMTTIGKLADALNVSVGDLMSDRPVVVSLADDAKQESSN